MRRVAAGIFAAVVVGVIIAEHDRVSTTSMCSSPPW